MMDILIGRIGKEIFFSVKFKELNVFNSNRSPAATQDLLANHKASSIFGNQSDDGRTNVCHAHEAPCTVCKCCSSDSTGVKLWWPQI